MTEASPPDNAPKPNTFIIPFSVAAGLFMEGLDSTIVATSLPQMARSLDVSPVHLSLAITSYILSIAIFTPISGWIADRYGAKRVFCTAIVIFTVASGLCAMAQGLPFLVAMRMLQGFGGSMMAPVARLILLQTFPKSQLLTVTNYMVLPALIGPMAGPVVGGFITQYFSWRWIFLINLPIGVIGLFLVMRLIKALPAQKPPPFDLPGFLIVAAGFALAQFWLECVGRDIVSPVVQVALFVAFISTFLAYGRYARSHANPVLDLNLFKIPSFSISIWWGSLSRLGIGGTPFLLPLLLQVGFGLAPSHAGILVFVSIVGAFFQRLGFSSVMRALGLRRTLVGNAIILTILLAGFILIDPATPQWFLVSYLFVFGFLRSVQFLSLNMASYADLGPEVMTRGNTIFTVSHRLSMSAGISVAAVALSAFGGHAHPGQQHFHTAFAVLAAIEFISIWGLWRMHPTTGREITGGGK
jgi:EmrB/QacA subfamily drug resistance transporter